MRGDPSNDRLRPPIARKIGQLGQQTLRQIDRMARHAIMPRARDIHAGAAMGQQTPYQTPVQAGRVRKTDQGAPAVRW